MKRYSIRLRGFSLLELMITIAVAAILAVIAVPSLRDVIHRNQVSAASNSLLAGLSYARTEAIDRGQMVSMCPSINGTSCVAGKTFDTGWIVYTYPAGAASANKVLDATSTLLRATTTLSGVSIQSANTEVITFGQQGQLKSTAMTTPKLDFVTCYRVGTSGTGSSTTKVPGAKLEVNGSGSVTTFSWPVGTDCTP